MSIKNRKNVFDALKKREANNTLGTTVIPEVLTKEFGTDVVEEIEEAVEETTEEVVEEETSEPEGSEEPTE